MAVISNGEIEAARAAKPGDIWYGKKSGNPGVIVRQVGTFQIVVEANNRRYQYMHMKFICLWRSTKPETT